MKLSFRFFLMAYIVVLMASSLGGAFLIFRINDTIWDDRVDRVREAVDNAAVSFMDFTDLYSTELTQTQKSAFLRQIRSNSSEVISDIRFLSPESGEVDTRYIDLPQDKYVERYSVETDEETGDAFLFITLLHLDTDTGSYYLEICSDFTQIREQSSQFWNIYTIAVLGIAIVSGLALYILTERATKPLKKLTETVDDIAGGDYGRKVEIKPSDDEEIRALSRSVNSMSDAIEEKIRTISDELLKRDTFVSDFTHEMKTPMTAIIGYAQMLKSYDMNEEERAQATDAILHESKRLESLSLQLLDLYVYRNEDVEKELVSLSEIGTQLQTTLQTLEKKYQVVFRCDLAKVTVSANRVLLLSLFSNLADNASKASEAGAEIRIGAVPEGNRIKCYVEDHGRGIAKENIEKITEPFFREDKSRSRKMGGAGLGLSLCKEIARLHGTDLLFTSEQGKGTTVSFMLEKGGEES